jgi:uncharacterized membrane protein (Fun14 family)
MSFPEMVLPVSAVASSSLWAVFGVSIGELGSGGTVGFVLGYVLKKLIRLVMYVAAIITGLNLAFLYWLQSVGILTVTFNPDRFSTGTMISLNFPNYCDNYLIATSGNL